MTVLRPILPLLLATLLLPSARLLAQDGISLRGALSDSLDASAVPYATVTVLSMSDSLIAGAISDDDGRFNFSGLKPGRVKIRVKALGYQQRDFGPYKLPGTPELNLQLSPPTQLMGPVEITDRVDYTQNKIDRKVYNVDRNMVTQGGSATDLLNTIPSVEVDMDGAINLRGNANVTVLIDGKPSSLTGSSRSAIIDQFPASAIKSIEVITHPSAKYDPDGTAGIINIITKKESRKGINGNISLGVGTNDKYNASGSINLRRKHFNAFANYSFRFEDRWNEGAANVSIQNDSTHFLQFQTTDGERRSREHLLKAGIDFYPGERTTIGLGTTFSRNLRTGFEDNLFDESNFFQFSQRYLRTTAETEPTQNIEGELNLQHKGTKPGRQLDGRISLARNTKADTERYQTDSLRQGRNDTYATGPVQTGSTPQTFILGTAQLDYTAALGKTRLETGLKSTLRAIDAAYIFAQQDEPAAPFVIDSTISNAFAYREQVHAGYLILGRSFGKISAEAGLRAEQALTGFTLLNNDSTYTNNYFNLFPSAHIARPLSERHELRLGYSRRINRPQTDDLNPFTEYANPKRLRRGNPSLQPEYIHAVELSHQWRPKVGSLSSTLYYRRLNNTVTRVINNIGGDTLETTFANMLSGHSYGLELIGQARPLKWLDLTLSANLFRTVMDASNIEPGLRLINYGVDGRAMASATFSRRWSLQTNYNYQPPRVGPQGHIAARHSMDAAVKHSFMKNKASLSLRVSDIFNTLHFQIDTELDGVYSEFYRKRESRIGFLTFAYRFGQEDRGEKKAKTKERENSGGGGFDF